MANAVARDTPRGWRVDKGGRSMQIDALVALCMTIERVDAKPEPVGLLGWI